MIILQEFDEEILENVIFVFKDVNFVNIGVKDNVYGIGYRGFDFRKVFFVIYVSLFFVLVIIKIGKKGIRGIVCIRIDEFCVEFVFLKFECF